MTFLPVVDPALRSALVSVLTPEGAPGGTITSYGTVFIIEAPTWATLVGPSDPFGLPTLVLRSAPPVAPAAPPSAPKATRKARSSAATVPPAEELRTLTGLSPATLAELFGVSRTAFYKWLDGATPRDERFQRLVEVVVHVKEARQRLPSSVDFGGWLRTPISPGAQAPLEYLREGKLTVFRGLILRAAATGGAVPVASAIPSRPTSRIERALARERTSPSPRAEDEG